MIRGSTYINDSMFNIYKLRIFTVPKVYLKIVNAMKIISNQQLTIELSCEYNEEEPDFTYIHTSFICSTG